MQGVPFTPDATDDLELAGEIERDAALLGLDTTIERYLPFLGDRPEASSALDAAIEVALRAACARDGLSPLEAARALARRHPALGDSVHAVALGFGLRDSDHDGPMEIGRVVLGRWRVVQLLGAGATAQVVRAQDELLSVDSAPFEVVIKRFDDGVGCDARLHALREMRALVGAPLGLAPRVLALHAPRGGAACLVTVFETTREMRIPDELDAAVRAVRRLHRSGITHGDLKPSHVRIRPDGSVLLVDFGSASAATPESCRQDLLRLLDMTASRRNGPATLLSRIARASRRNAPLAGLLRLCSPRWRRRAIAGGCAVAALAAAIALGWRSWRASTQQSDALAAIAATGRLVDATLDARGRLISMRLDLPEMTALHPRGAEGRVVTGPIRFLPGGGAVIFDIHGNPLSR